LEKESKKNTFIKKYLQPNVGFSQIVVTETKETKTPLISGQIDEGNDLKTHTIALFNTLQSLLKEFEFTF
jgi:hypothetical protein